MSLILVYLLSELCLMSNNSSISTRLVEAFWHVGTFFILFYQNKAYKDVKAQNRWNLRIVSKLFKTQTWSKFAIFLYSSCNAAFRIHFTPLIQYSFFSSTFICFIMKEDIKKHINIFLWFSNEVPKQNIIKSFEARWRVWNSYKKWVYFKLAQKHQRI